MMGQHSTTSTCCLMVSFRWRLIGANMAFFLRVEDELHLHNIYGRFSWSKPETFYGLWRFLQVEVELENQIIRFHHVVTKYHFMYSFSKSNKYSTWLKTSHNLLVFGPDFIESMNYRQNQTVNPSSAENSKEIQQLKSFLRLNGTRLMELH